MFTKANETSQKTIIYSKITTINNTKRVNNKKSELNQWCTRLIEIIFVCSVSFVVLIYHAFPRNDRK